MLGTAKSGRVALRPGLSAVEVASGTINGLIQSGTATRRAAGKHVQFVDAYASMSATVTSLPDGLHPGLLGYAMLASPIIAAVLDLRR